MFLCIQMNAQDRTIQKRKYLSLYSTSGKKPSTKPKKTAHKKITTKKPLLLMSKCLYIHLLLSHYLPEFFNLQEQDRKKQSLMMKCFIWIKHLVPVSSIFLSLQSAQPLFQKLI